MVKTLFQVGYGTFSIFCSADVFMAVFSNDFVFTSSNKLGSHIIQVNYIMAYCINNDLTGLYG